MKLILSALSSPSSDDSTSLSEDGEEDKAEEDVAIVGDDTGGLVVGKAPSVGKHTQRPVYRSHDEFDDFLKFNSDSEAKTGDPDNEVHSDSKPNTASLEEESNSNPQGEQEKSKEEAEVEDGVVGLAEKKNSAGNHTQRPV